CGNDTDGKKPDPPKQATPAPASASQPASSATATQPASQPASSVAATQPVSQPASSVAAAATQPASQPAASEASSGTPDKPDKPPAPPAAPVGSGGDDLIKPALEIYRLAACGGDDKERAGKHDAKLVAKHCRELTALYDKYRKKWVDVAVPYLEALRPTD